MINGYMFWILPKVLNFLIIHGYKIILFVWYEFFYGLKFL